MEQRSPFTSQYNVLRLNPLTKAVAARSMTEGSAKSAAATANTNGPGAKGPSGIVVDAKPDPTAEEISTAEAAAANGDQQAIDWLSGLRMGVAGAGIAAGGVALHGAMRNRNRAKTSGASGTAVDATMASPTRSGLPAVHITPTEVIEPQDYLPQQENLKRIGTGQARVGSGIPPRGASVAYDPTFNALGPTQQQMQMEQAYMQKGLQDAKTAQRQAQTGQGAAARRAYEAADALKKIRRMPR